MKLRLKKLISISMTLMLSSFLQVCGPAAGEDTNNEEEEKTPPVIENKESVELDSVLDCKEGTSLDYDNFGESFFLSYCTSCHSSQLAEGERAGAPVTINLNSLSDIQIWRQKILSTSGSPAGNTMPPVDHVPSEERVALREWLNCGAPGGDENLD